MAEIRLICPGCAAEYRVPDTAIPSEGREVECSACGNVWHATAEPEPLAVFPARIPAEPAPDLPRLNRRLPDTVLDILRDEVEHERRARAAAGGSDGDTDAARDEPVPDKPAAPMRPSADPEWPATTITRHIEARPVEVAPPPIQAQVQPTPARPADPEPQDIQPRQTLPDPAQPTATLDTAAPVIAAPVTAAPAPQPSAPQPIPAAPHALPPVPIPQPAHSSKGGYGAGFGLAAMLAAACVALYLMAPSMADQGGFGKGLMHLRGQVDEARLWLQDRTGR